MNSIYYQPYECPIGKVRLRASDEGLLALEHWNQQEQLPDSWIASDSHPILLQARSELDEYFALKRQVFSTPLAPIGTAFQRRVWDALLEIPFGETCSYSDIAHAIGNSKAVRAVGLANGKNPLSIFIPCHRVIGKNGKLTGYAGGISIKETLLRLEGEPELF